MTKSKVCKQNIKPRDGEGKAEGRDEGNIDSFIRDLQEAEDGTLGLSSILL